MAVLAAAMWCLVLAALVRPRAVAWAATLGSALAWIPVPLFLLGVLIGPRPFNHPAMAWFPVLSGWREGPECLPGPFAAISPGVQALVTVLGWAVMVWALRRAAHADKPG